MGTIAGGEYYAIGNAVNELINCEWPEYFFDDPISRDMIYDGSNDALEDLREQKNAAKKKE